MFPCRCLVGETFEEYTCLNIHIGFVEVHFGFSTEFQSQFLTAVAEFVALVQGPDLCYGFLGLEVFGQNSRQVIGLGLQGR